MASLNKGAASAEGAAYSDAMVFTPARLFL
jgi:hypothetical protein